MKSFSMPLLAIMTAAVVVGMVTIGMQHASAFGFVEFKKLTHEFEKNVISGQWNPGDTPPIRVLVDDYGQDIMDIFLGGPDTIPGLLEQYQLAVLAVFTPPPEPDKQAQHDQIKEFRQLTHAFEKAVIGAINPPDGD